MIATARCFRWIPWAFAGALGVVVAVNGALAYFAVSSSTGLVTAHPYDAGNGYNRVLAAAAAQDALGWRGTLRFVSEGAARGRIEAVVTDEAGRPLAGLAVNAQLSRPVEPLPAREMVLAEAQTGHYEAPLTISRPGQWEVHVAARRGGDLYEFVQRIVVK